MPLSDPVCAAPFHARERGDDTFRASLTDGRSALPNGEVGGKRKIHPLFSAASMERAFSRAGRGLAGHSISTAPPKAGSLPSRMGMVSVQPPGAGLPNYRRPSLRAVLLGTPVAALRETVMGSPSGLLKD